MHDSKMNKPGFVVVSIVVVRKDVALLIALLCVSDVVMAVSVGVVVVAVSVEVIVVGAAVDSPRVYKNISIN